MQRPDGGGAGKNEVGRVAEQMGDRALETDYSKIAERYDNNLVRIKGVDEVPGRIREAGRKVKVLDMACGTGSYLKTQSEYYGFEDFEWTGVDKSPEMLVLARQKNPDIMFINSAVEDLSDSLSGFDYINNEFAFHHFSDKDRAVRKMSSILSSKGLLHIRNICPDYMKNYWVYHYFPESEEIDKERFIQAPELAAMLNSYGFAVRMNVEVDISDADYASNLKEALNRDISQLNLISDAAYNRGIDAMRRDMAAGRKLVTDFALISVDAEKKGSL